MNVLVKCGLSFLPDAVNRVFAYALLPGQSASAPVRGFLGLALERRFDNSSHLGLRIKRFASSTWRNLPNATDSLLTNATPLQFQFGTSVTFNGSGSIARDGMA